MHIADQFGLYLLSILSVVIVLVSILTFNKFRGRFNRFKSYHIILITLIISSFTFLLFDIDWGQTGEEETMTLSGKFALFMLGLTNLVSITLVGITKITFKLISRHKKLS